MHMRRLRPLLLVLTLLAAVSTSASAQNLDSALQRVASAWQRGEVGAITGMAARGGMTINVDGGSVGPLGSRQAAAALRRVLDDRLSVSARPTMSRTLGGQPARAFGEITWTARARGTTMPERATLFVAFVQEGDGWRITEIRLMR
jgi:hypothetical protein